MSKQAFTHLTMELQKTLKEILLEKKVLKIYAESEAGEQLKDKIAEEITEAVYSLMKYRDMDRDQLVSYCARIESYFSVGRLLRDAPTQVKNLEQDVLEEESSN